jgi:hypothetical protein
VVFFVFFSIGFGTVATAWRNNSKTNRKKYHAVATVPKPCGIFCIFFYWFLDCCYCVVFFVFFSIGFVTVATAWYFFYWFLNCCDSVVFFSIGFGTVATAWYFLYFFYWFWNCCDSVVFYVFFLLVLELLRQRGINSSKTNRKNTKNTTPSQKYQNQKKKIPRRRNISKSNRKNTTLSQQLQNQ